MDIAAGLAADLADLSRALDRPEIDLETHLRTLIGDLQRAVPSYLGLRMTMIVEGRPLSFSTYTGNDAWSQIRSSLMVPLPAFSGVDSGSSLVLHAAAPGAFVDLAADLSHALQLDLADLVLDEDRPAAQIDDGIHGLSGSSDVSRAIGVLISQGHTVESARAELRRLAALDSGDLHHASAAVLAATRKPRGDGRS